MAQSIRKDIYESLFTSTIIIYPQGLTDSLGDAVEGTAVTYNGYVYENTEKVLNDLGTEVLSHTQIYLRGVDAKSIAINSLVSCADTEIVKQRLISRKVYRGKNSASVIGILYLP